MGIRWFLLFGGRSRFCAPTKTWTNRPVPTPAKEYDTLAVLTWVVSTHLIGVCRQMSQGILSGGLPLPYVWELSPGYVSGLLCSVWGVRGAFYFLT